MLGRLPLRVQLIVPLVAVPLLLAAVVGWLSYRSAHRGVDEMAWRLQGADSDRIQELTDAHFANWTYVLDAAKGPLLDRASVERRLWNASSISQVRPTYVYFAYPDGRFVGVQHSRDGGATLRVRDRPGEHPRSIFRKDHVEAPGQWLGDETVSLVAHRRPWYAAATGAIGNWWSEPYADHLSGEPTLTLAFAQRDAEDVLQGIYGVDVPLQEVGGFLRRLSVDRYGVAYIVLRDGRLLASSLPADPTAVSLVQAHAHPNATLAASYRAIAPQLDLHNIFEPGEQQRDVETSVGPMRVSAVPWGQIAGLDGWLVVALRRDLLTAGIDDNAWRTALLAALAAMAALAVGLLLAGSLLREIRLLTGAAEAMSAPGTAAIDATAEAAPAPLRSTRRDELGRLSNAFDRMVVRLKASNDELHRRGEAMTQTAQRLSAEISARDATEARLRSVTDAMGEAFVILDAGCRIRSVNRRTLKFTQMPDAESLLGRPVDDFLPPSPSPVGAALREAFAEGHPRIVRYRFGERWYEMRAYPSPQGMAVFFADVTKREEAREALAEREREMRQLAGRLLTTQSEERRTIARELHDEIGQQLAALRINLQRLQAQAPSADAGSPQGLHSSTGADRLADSLAIVKDVVAQVRNRALDLHPAILDDLGLVAALEWMAERQGQRAGVVIRVHEEGSLPAVPPHVGLACYRIAQEAINNALRHGEARRIDIDLGVGTGADGCELLSMVVADDGTGFDAQAVTTLTTATTATTVGAKLPSLGLLSMRERAQQLGGAATIVSSLGRAGTRVEVSIPLETVT